MPIRPDTPPARCDHCGAIGRDDIQGDVRCPCGCLLARRLPEGLELKCRRCKRAVVIAHSPEEVATTR